MVDERKGRSLGDVKTNAQRGMMLLRGRENDQIE